MLCVVSGTLTKMSMRGTGRGNCGWSNSKRACQIDILCVSCPSSSLLLLGSQHLDLDQDILGQASDLDARAGRLVRRKELAIDLSRGDVERAATQLVSLRLALLTAAKSPIDLR